MNIYNRLSLIGHFVSRWFDHKEKESILTGVAISILIGK